MYNTNLTLNLILLKRWSHGGAGIILLAVERMQGWSSHHLLSPSHAKAVILNSSSGQYAFHLSLLKVLLIPFNPFEVQNNTAQFTYESDDFVVKDALIVTLKKKIQGRKLLLTLSNLGNYPHNNLKLMHVYTIWCTTVFVLAG